MLGTVPVQLGHEVLWPCDPSRGRGHRTSLPASVPPPVPPHASGWLRRGLRACGTQRSWGWWCLRAPRLQHQASANFLEHNPSERGETV